MVILLGGETSPFRFPIYLHYDFLVDNIPEINVGNVIRPEHSLYDYQASPVDEYLILMRDGT